MDIKQKVFSKLPKVECEFSQFDFICRIIEGKSLKRCWELHIVIFLCIDRNTEVLIHECSPRELEEPGIESGTTDFQLHGFFFTTVPHIPTLHPASFLSYKDPMSICSMKKGYRRGKSPRHRHSGAKILMGEPMALVREIFWTRRSSRWWSVVPYRVCHHLYEHLRPAVPRNGSERSLTLLF